MHKQQMRKKIREIFFKIIFSATLKRGKNRTHQTLPLIIEFFRTIYSERERKIDINNREKRERDEEIFPFNMCLCIIRTFLYIS